MGYQNRRRRLFLHNLQIQLVVAILGLVIGVSVILLISLFLIFKNNISTLPISEELTQEVLHNSMLSVVIIAIVLLIASLWAIIMITHKIYGPLHRLRTYMKKLSNGEVTDELKFRKGDAVDGLKEIYNDLRERLEKTLHHNYEEMVTIFSELQETLDKMHGKKMQNEQLFNALQETCNRLAKALDITSEAIESEKE